MLESLLSREFKNSRLYEHFLLLEREYHEVLEKILLLDENYKLELENMMIACQYDQLDSDTVHFNIEFQDKLFKNYYIRIKNGNEIVFCAYGYHPETNEKILSKEIRMTYYTRSDEYHQIFECCYDVRNFGSENQLLSGTLMIYDKEGRIKTFKNYDTTQNQNLLVLSKQMENYQLSYLDSNGILFNVEEEQHLPYGLSFSNLILEKKRKI